MDIHHFIRQASSDEFSKRIEAVTSPAYFRESFCVAVEAGATAWLLGEDFNLGLKQRSLKFYVQSRGHWAPADRPSANYDPFYNENPHEPRTASFQRYLNIEVKPLGNGMVDAEAMREVCEYVRQVMALRERPPVPSLASPDFERYGPELLVLDNALRVWARYEQKTNTAETCEVDN